jgi:8-oxo-dGTP pyrophosphatase MutT (NUDIX family)
MNVFKYCPNCKSEKIEFIANKKFVCPDCGFTYYQNTAAATACIISNGEGILFLVRGKEPAKGKLDLPGGFVDPGEGVVEGLRRECREELGWDPETVSPPSLFSLFTSFPNVYPYKNIVYNTCDMFFTITVPGLTEKDFRLEAKEVAGIRFVRPEDVDYGELSFDSVRRAIRAYVGRAPLTT